MIAFTFPGQGSQRPGMGAPWKDHESWELVTEASDLSGRDIGHLLLETEAEELTDTRNAQIATFVLSLVVLDAVVRTGVVPARLAGHSLGEYSALAAAGVLGFEDGVRLVTERGDAMADAGGEQVGTMAAVLGLDDDQVEIACSRVAGDVWVANFNAPGQVVIAGSPDAIEQAGVIAKEMGAKRVMSVPVSGAFHTPFMADARSRLNEALSTAELRDAETPVLANVDALPHTEASDWGSLMAAQLCSPVRWRQITHNLADSGVNTFVELGPGNVLTGMVKRTIKASRNLSVSGPEDLDSLLEQLSGQPAAECGQHEGEHLFATERMVVSPSAGVFTPHATAETGLTVNRGDVLGTVSEQEVRSPFAGTIMGVLALDGERVTQAQPIAWLRTTP
jgi:[acyl-carrier-protein] S-malonyltransferase